MEQLEMDMKNTDEFLSKKGYGLPSMSPRIEARFGRLMLSHAKDSGMFKEAERRFPKPAKDPKIGITIALSMRGAKRRDLVLRLAEKNGVTVKDLVAASDLPGKKASHILSAQKSRGYLRVFGYVEGKCGNKINVYVLTEKGKALLERINE